MSRRLQVLCEQNVNPGTTSVWRRPIALRSTNRYASFINPNRFTAVLKPFAQFMPDCFHVQPMQPGPVARIVRIGRGFASAISLAAAVMMPTPVASSCAPVPRSHESRCAPSTITSSF